MTQDVSVVLAGPTKSGKTNLYSDLVRCIQTGTHGYPGSLGLKAEVGLIERRELRMLGGRLDESTNSLEKISFTLGYSNPARQGQAELLKVHVIDPPGEASIPLAGINNDFSEKKKQLDELTDDAVGIVLVISVLDANNPQKFDLLLRYVEDLLLKYAESGSVGTKRLAIAVSMFDLLMLRFGSKAFDVAVHPDSILLILKEHLQPVHRILRDFSLPGESPTWLDIRIAAVSSYGFIPEFGCPNLNMRGVPLDKAAHTYPEPLVRETHYPFLTADPFVFAATGIGNRFLFKLDQILGI